MSKRRVILIVGFALAAVFALPHKANAETASMEGVGAPSSGWYGTSSITCDYGQPYRAHPYDYGFEYINPANVDCIGWSWVFYEYVGGGNHTEPNGYDSNGDEKYAGMYFPHYEAGFGVKSEAPHDSGAWIPGECEKEGQGFWHMGRNLEAEYNNSLGNIGGSTWSSTKHDLIHRDTYTYNFLYNMWGGFDKANLEATDSWSASGRRAKLAEGWYHGTYWNSVWLTPEGVNTPLATINPFLGNRVLKLNHTLKYNGNPIYRALRYGTDTEVKEIYKAKTGKDMSGNVWGFCSYEGTPPNPQSYTGEVKITVNASFSDGGGSKTKTDTSDDAVYELKSDTITYVGQGKVTAQDTDSPQQDTNYKVTVSPSGESDTYDANDTWRGPGTQTETLIPGKVYTVCATNNYASTYEATRKEQFGDYQEISACIKVKYDTPCDYFEGKNVGDFEDYGRMEIYKDSTAALAVGDDGKDGDSGEVYKYPGQKLSIRYYGCMGVQAGIDAKGSGNEVVYQVDGNGVNSLYESTNNYIDEKSRATRSISAFELGLIGSRWNENGLEATNSEGDRKTQRYQFGNDKSWTSMQPTELGTRYQKTYSWPKSDGSTKTITAWVNTPYNYFIDPQIDKATDTMLTMGSTYTLKFHVNVEGRENAKLGDKKATDVKPKTITRASVFTVGEDVDLDRLNQILNDENIKKIGEGGKYIYYADESQDPMSKISGIEGVEGFGSMEDFLEKDNSEITRQVPVEAKIGTKVCGVVAAWPGDSHNYVTFSAEDGSLDTTISADVDQSNALTMGAGTNPFWSFQVSCSTLVKYPNMSVEGGSAITKGEAKGGHTLYGERTFGSWTEYDLIANPVTRIGSGASLAYTNAQNSVNIAVDHSQYGAATGINMSPQTLGNFTTPLGIGNDAEASRYFDMAAKFRENMKSNYCDGYKCTGTGDLAFPYNESGAEEVTISNDIYASGTNTVNIIYGKNIKIDSNVTHIDAILIADENIDTCNGEMNKRTNDGNQALYANCNKELVVNGAVVAKSISLDRTFGGGDINGETISPNSLSQRAEIFNYDPRIVKAIYDLSNTTKATDVVYIKELSPRL